MLRAHVAIRVSHGSVSAKSFLIRLIGSALRDVIGDEVGDALYDSTQAT